MKILTLHSDYLEFEPKIKALKDAEEFKKEKHKIEECLVVFSAVEKTDESNPEQIAKNCVKEIIDVCKQIDCKNIVIYPYVHLTQNPSSSSSARKILSDVQELLKKEKYSVSHAPFGWYKSLHISVKGHPLAELSREIKTEKIEREPVKEEFLVMDEKQKLIKPEDYKYKKGEENFKILVEKEALKKELKGGEEPEYIKYCKRFGIDWEPMSDLGHMRYNPLGNFIFEMIADYSKQLAESLNIPIYSVRGTQMFNLNEKAVREHAELFGERLYEMQVENKRFVLRYAACHQQFAILKDWAISYKNLPFGAFEVADSYRLEQSGELLLCFRVRKMHMPDLHVICKDIEDAKEWSIKLHKKIYEEFKKLNKDLVCVYNLTKSFYNENKDFFKELLKIEKKPILLRFVPENKFYWVINVEHHIIDQMKRPREMATWQIDIGNAERFGIKFTDKDNKQKHPVIVHTAILGTIERYLYTLFDSALDEKNSCLPIWLTPIQVRLCPVNDSFIKYCEEIADELEKSDIRVDIDNRVESIEKKVRDAEMEWVPFIVVIGEKEKKSGKLAVRFRKTGKVENISEKEITEIIKKETKEMPFKKLPLPRLISKRPTFI